MRCQNHLHRLVNVAPFRVVVALFGDQRCAAHEAERLVEIPEHEGSPDGLPVRQFGPTGQSLEGRFSRLRRQPFRHDRLLFDPKLTLISRGRGLGPPTAEPKTDPIVASEAVPVTMTRLSLRAGTKFVRISR